MPQLLDGIMPMSCASGGIRYSPSEKQSSEADHRKAGFAARTLR
jgi:hypothetical protein